MGVRVFGIGLVLEPGLPGQQEDLDELLCMSDGGDRHGDPRFPDLYHRIPAESEMDLLFCGVWEEPAFCIYRFRGADRHLLYYSGGWGPEFCRVVRPGHNEYFARSMGVVVVLTDLYDDLLERG